MTGRIFDIQRFSLHDGPGIRTTVFLKGCNLRCRWCHNPESILPQNELQTYPAKCIGCGGCLERCPNGAVSLGPAGVVVDRAACAGCGRCAGACVSGALSLAGREVSAQDVLQAVLRDRSYYESSGGGVTFSGGEPMLQHDFLRQALALCAGQGIDRAVETAGNVPWEWFAEVLPLVNLFLYDIKHVDDEAHRRGTGSGCGLIQRNLSKLMQSGAGVWVRIPVIPGFNADEGSMEAIAARLAGLAGYEKIELLPFHRLGAGKCESLGREYEARGLDVPSQQKMEALAGRFAAHGLTVSYAAGV